MTSRQACFYATFNSFLRLLISIIKYSILHAINQNASCDSLPKVCFYKCTQSNRSLSETESEHVATPKMIEKRIFGSVYAGNFKRTDFDNEAFGSSRSFLVYLKTSLYFSYIVFTLKQKSLREWSIPFSDLQFGEIVGVSPKGYVYK